MVNSVHARTSPCQPPPYLLGLAAIFWGFFSGHPILGATLAPVVESHRYLRIRWEWTEKHSINFWNFSLILLFVIILIPIIENPNLVRINQQFLWAPIAFLPILLAQQYSTHSTLPLGTFFITMRWKAKKYQLKAWQTSAYKPVNIGYAYFLVLLLSTGLANTENPYFYFCGALLLAFACTRLSNNYKHQLLLRLCLWCALIYTGYQGHIGLHTLHQRLEQMALDFYARFHQLDPYKATTRIGELGRLKQSAHIVWTLTPEKGQPPVLLKDASYDTFKQNHWLNTADREFNALEETNTGGRNAYVLNTAPDPKAVSMFKLTGRPGTETVYLPLPYRTFSLLDLRANDVAYQVASGITRVRDFATLLNFHVTYQHKGNSQSPPDRGKDLEVPPSEKAAILSLAESLKVATLPAKQAITVIQQHFRQAFTYSLYQPAGQWEPSETITPLAYFLQQTRSGHCEYFATATVFLLRAAGIPARYAVGYSVQEHDASQDIYYIRSMHAHAWAEAWIDGQWLPVDTTPPTWASMDAANQSVLQPLWDRLNAVYNGFLMLRQEGLSDRQRNWLIAIILVVLVVYLPLRMFKGHRAQRRQLQSSEVPDRGPHGPPSALANLEPLLAERNCTRAPHETWQQWLIRHENVVDADIRAALRNAIVLHYAVRFASAIPDRAQVRKLEQAVADIQQLLTENKH